MSMLASNRQKENANWASRLLDRPLKKSCALFLRGKINPLTLRWTGPRGYELSKTLVIAGSPRSGTTWLAELVCMIPDSALLFEPLNLHRVSLARLAGFNWRTYVDQNEKWAKGEEFLETVLRGKLLNAWTTSHIPLKRSLCVRRWVVKFVRANMMLRWLGDRFPIPAPLFIIRHPCATVASQLQQKWSKPMGAPQVPKFMAAYPQFTEVLEKLHEPEEFLAVRWCIENYAPLAGAHPHPFQIVSYEGLVRDGRKELQRIFETWNIELPKQTLTQLENPSMTTKKRSLQLRGVDRLESWKRVLSADQIDRILRIVKAFGLDFYGEASQPDYDRLHGSSPLSTSI